MKLRLLSISFLLLTLGACVGIQDAMRNAELYSNSDVPEKAYEEYLSVYQRKGNAEAFIGMKKSAEAILAKKAGDINMSILSADEVAFDRIAEYEQLLDDFKRNGLDLAHRQQLDLWQDNAVQAVSEKYVGLAQSRLKLNDYEGARTAIRRIEGINRNDERVDALWTLSEVVEHYKLGKDYLDLGLKEQALEEFNEVVRRDAQFADALSIRDEIIDDLSFTIAYVTLDNQKVSNEAENLAATRIQQAILNLDKPFMHLVERDQLVLVLNEQQVTMGAAFHDENAIEAGKLMGAEFILSGKFQNYQMYVNESSVQEKFAYKGKNAALSRRVKYEERELNWYQDVVFSWKLIDAETGKVHRSGTIPFADEGNLKVATYHGNHRELYPGDVMLGVFPTPWDKVHKDSKSREEFRAMFEHENLPQLQLMKEDVFSKIALDVAAALEDFNGEH